MKKDKIVLRGIISEIEQELQHLEELQREVDAIKDKKDIISRRAKGSILYDFYNLCQRIFKKIAVEINQGYNDTATWPKSLLYKMTIPLRGIRPPVISEELAAELDEYLAFRHLFQNIYGFELKSDRIDRLAEKFEVVKKRFSEEIEKFLDYLKQEYKKA